MRAFKIKSVCKHIFYLFTAQIKFMKFVRVSVSGSEFIFKNEVEGARGRGVSWKGGHKFKVQLLPQHDSKL